MFKLMFKKISTLFASGILAFSSCDSPEINYHSLTTYQGKTNDQGEVEFNGIPIKVVDQQTETPLSGKKVTYLIDDQNYLLLVADNSGHYFPRLLDGKRSSLEINLEDKDGFKQKAQIEHLIVALNTANTAYNVVLASLLHNRQLIEEGKNINKYCVGKEQMDDVYVEIPAGILLLAGSFPGKEITIADAVLISSLFEYEIKKFYGEQEGYEVWEPKVDVSLCETEYRGAVCPITTESLAQKLWSSEVPVWKIVGPCRPGNKIVENDDPKNNEEDNYTKTFEDLFDHLELDKWQVLSGTPKIEDGRLKLEGEEALRTKKKVSCPEDFYMEVRLSSSDSFQITLDQIVLSYAESGAASLGFKCHGYEMKTTSMVNLSAMKTIVIEKKDEHVLVKVKTRNELAADCYLAQEGSLTIFSQGTTEIDHVYLDCK